MICTHKFVVVLLFGLVALPPCAIAQAFQAPVDAPVEKAKIVDIKDYAQGRVRDWAGHVPIYDGYPVYDITLDVAGKKHIVRYESVTGYFPSIWKQGNEIDVKLANHRVYLLKGSEEFPADIVTSVANDCVQTNFPNTVDVVPSQLPCQ